MVCLNTHVDPKMAEKIIKTLASRENPLHPDFRVFFISEPAEFQYGI
jgi:hypothetical protein